MTTVASALCLVINPGVRNLTKNTNSWFHTSYMQNWDQL